MAYGNTNVPGPSETEMQALRESAQAASDKIGATGDTGGSASGGTVFGKLNKLITDLASHMGRWTAARAESIDTIKTDVAAMKTGLDGGTAKMGAVKSVQRGISIFDSYQDTSVDIQINTVDPDKCIVILDGTTSLTDNIYSNVFPIVTNLSATKLIVGLSGKPNKSLMTYEGYNFSWQVIEFY